MLKILLILMYLKLYLQQMYDEDISPAFPEPDLGKNPLDNPNPKYWGTINNCTCREEPDVMITCFESFVPCEKFPAPKNITTSTFRVKLTSITIIYRNDLQTLKNLLTLEIQSNKKLVHIEPGAFKNLNNLLNLSISFNQKLRHLEENVFEGLFNLKMLQLQNNGFYKLSSIVHSLAPKYLNNLIILSLSENTFNTISATDFHPLNGTKIQQLILRFCQIEFMHPDFLAPFKYLDNLRIGQNLFNETTLAKVIDRSMELKIPIRKINVYKMGFRKKTPYILLEAIGRSNITQLYMSCNNFQYLDSGSFPPMPLLEKLSFKADFIMDIRPGTFTNLKNLKGLSLTENKLTSIPSAALIPTLQELDLSGNTEDLDSYLFSIGTERFRNMTNLQNLQLAFNTINSIDENTFVGLKNLLHLNLKKTSLYSLDAGIFKDLIKLEYLNLNFNPLSNELTSEVFKGLFNLKILLLAGCNIRKLNNTPNIFKHTPNLIHLGLEKNNLLFISSSQLIHLDKLESLNLAGNQLTVWNYHILPRENLRLLDATQNKITHITFAMLDDWKELDILYLDGNPFRCDCSLYPVVVWYRINSPMCIKFYQGEDFIAPCLTPESWRHKSIVAYMATLLEDGSECEEYSEHMRSISLIITCLITFISTIVLCVICYFYRWYIEFYIFKLRLKLKRYNKPSSNEIKLDKGNLKYDAFISYSTEDRDFVLNLVKKMENHDPFLRLCIYERDFQLGATISDAIIQSVVMSRRTVLVLSDAFAKSNWCRWETQIAKYHHLFFRHDSKHGPDDTLLVIKYKEISKRHLTPVLKYLMKTRIYLQWDPHPIKKEIFFQKLRYTLASTTHDEEAS